jgi:ribulose-phosphate 3-epimerase
MDILPAIIGKDFDEVEDKIFDVENFVTWVHIDIMDGVFTPAETWPFVDIKESPKELYNIDTIRTDNVRAEVHLMTKHPEKSLSKWIEAGADRVMLHYESTDEETLSNIFTELTDTEVESGIVLKYETPITVLDSFIDQIDVVQLMSIAKIGSYGLPFEDGIYDKIKSLRARYPGVTISVDGGVNLENASKLIQAGADYLVVGSAIFKSENIEQTIKKFQSI